MKRLILFFLLISAATSSYAQNTNSVTATIMRRYDRAWNHKDARALVGMIRPNAIFESPYHIRMSRDSIMSTVFKSELAVMDDLKTTEYRSQISGNMAWSIGKVTGNVYNSRNKKSFTPWHATYTFEFTKRAGGNWKIQMMVFYEK